MQHRNKNLKVDDIIKMIQARRMALPEFQRQFVWKPNAVLELVDSLINGWPIGTLLLLDGPQPFAIRGIEGGPELRYTPEQIERISIFILDGQQRITSLFHVFTDTGDTQYLIDLGTSVLDEASSITWRKRTTDKDDRNLKDTQFTLATALNDTKFEKAIQKWPSATRLQLHRMRQKRLGHLLNPNLEIPCILLERGIQLDALTRIFETLNRTGTPLDAFDLMVALLYPEDFYLSDQLIEAKHQFPTLANYDAEGLEILKLIALWQRDRELGEHDYIRPPEKRVRGVRQRDVLNTPPGFIRDNWPNAIESYSKALDWMRDEGGVQDAKSIPSKAMILTLAYRIHENDNPTFIRKWYWSSLGLQAYAQGANTQVIADLSQQPAETNAEPHWTQIMMTSLLDESRRNRTLRMGLRGLATRNHFLDILDGSKLDGAVRDISMLQLQRGYVGTPANELLADRVFINEHNVANLRRQLSTFSGEPVDLLNRDAIETQFATEYTHPIKEMSKTDQANRAKRRAEALVKLCLDLAGE